jgi:hypothetical protein
MKIMLETTTWEDGFGENCNHVYVFNDSMSQAVAYVPRGSKKLFRFKNPLKIDTRGRTFVELEQGAEETPDPEVITVEGSKGSKYYLTQENGQWTCTCPGFKYRGSCKHVVDRLPN